ncbi:BglG family transcription antiterminator [Sporolactobacillus sp. CQH2019]|uniref:BglG family transcription antiterminator n=1 Tax=Sporolactobacillus sp. CQH2019 TaxID=3023512 RepID=UPI0023683767|nr:BglG family transcription antiterminator [Sporolactobacillus sp. CQH2019]MDD9150862.1 BglG family transcription antiterminator [Sporolactobacillus sp. CQH2019]
MYLSKRSDMLLKDLLTHRIRTSRELQTKYSLSRRQVDYSISKLNEWLDEKHYPCIEHTSSGAFVASSQLLKMMGNSEKGEGSQKKNNDWYVSSRKERCYVIILMIITRSEQLSVNHFVVELGVSRNTVLRDLKEVSEVLNGFQLELVYSRKDGYRIIGKEGDKRFVLIKIMNHLINMYDGEALLQHFMNVSQTEITSWRRKLEQVENRLSWKFVDSKMQLLPYVLESIFKRVAAGHIIENVFFADPGELSDTREYAAADLLINGRKNLPKEERMYITLQVLTSNIIPSKDFMFDDIPSLEHATEDFLDLFEKNTCVTLTEKETLFKKLMAHLKPAYYRVKYRLSYDYSGLQQISQEYRVINYFVKISLAPLQKLIDCPIPDKEILFISLFIGSHLINFGTQFSSKLKALVVCTNGISISLLMEKTLKDMFPEMLFYKAVSLREFKKFPFPYDIVFSSIPVETKPKSLLFIVNNLMNDKEKLRLKHNVIKEIYHLNNEDLDGVQKIISIIEKYACIKEKEKGKLQSALTDFFVGKNTDYSHPFNSKELSKQSVHLQEIMPVSMIQQVDRVAGWAEALEIAARPLLQAEVIEQRYLQTLKIQYSKPATQIMLGQSIALPHAEPQYGANKLGMSLLHIRSGLETDASRLLYFIVILSAIDKKSHFNALLELTRIAQSKSCIERMKKAGSCRELYHLMKEFSSHCEITV